MDKYANVDLYLARPRRWRAEITQLRAILLDCGLSEAIKWGKPCYSHGDNNILILQPMKDFLAAMFFKGALMKDPTGLLQSQGENSRSARRLCFTSVEQVEKSQKVIRAFVREAIAVEDKGLTLPDKPELVLVEELQARLDGNAALKKAFHKLTPGRQREYHLHISGAKQSATRERRVDQFVPRILAGKGFRDR